jgi:hypothetical protein
VLHLSDAVIQLCDHYHFCASHTVKQNGIKIIKCSIEDIEDVVNQDASANTADLRFL